MVAGVQAVGEVKANPINLPASPNKDVPAITIDTLYDEGALLSFTVSCPDSWDEYSDINEVNCQLDDQANATLYYRGLYANLSRLAKETQFAVSLGDLAVGQHILLINVFSYSKYMPPPTPGWVWWEPHQRYCTIVTQEVPFTVEETGNIVTASPLPTPALTVYITQFSPKEQLPNSTSSPPPTPRATVTAKPTVTPNQNVPQTPPNYTTKPAPSQTPQASSPSPTPTVTQTVAPARQSTQKPSPTVNPTQAEQNFAPIVILCGLSALAIAISVSVYFKKKRKLKG